MLTQERLKEVLHYNPDTGIFTWKPRPELSWIDKTINVKWAGNQAGWTDCKNYEAIAIDCKSYMAHRLAFLYMTGSFPNKILDHINRVPNDNRWINLRESSRIQNGQNRKLHYNSKTGITGVTYDKRRNYFVTIRVNKKLIYLGTFQLLEEATLVRRDAEKKYFGEFAPIRELEGAA